MAKTVALAIAHAVLFAAAFPGIGLWPVTFISVVPLVWLAINARSTRRAVLTVLVVQWAMWLWINQWLIAVTTMGYPLLGAYLSLYTALFVWIIRRISRHRGLRAWPMTVVVPVVWVGIECLRGEFLFDGYPWFILAHPTIEWPILAQSADLFGTYFLSFLVAMVAGSVVDLARVHVGQWPARRLVVVGIVTLAVHGGNLGYGLWRLRQADVAMPAPSLLVIQTNLAQDNKIAWEPQRQVDDVRTFIDLTRQAHNEVIASGKNVDLVIWPETMLPGFGLEPEAIRTLVEGDFFPGDLFSTALVELSEQLKTPMLVGSPAYVGLETVDDMPRWQAKYNSAYLIDGDPPYQRYDKVFLTPFGETMPYISNWPWLEDKMLAVGAKGMSFNLDASRAINRVTLRWTPRSDGAQAASLLKPQASLILATPICFEDTVARVCRRMIYSGRRKAADIFVNLSNDGWFTSFDARRKQHAQIARFRCIENRVPMVRAVNTGLSMAINSTGAITRSVGEGRYGVGRRAGWLAAELQLDSRSTLYGAVGEVWPWACLAATVALAGCTMISRKGESAT